MIVEYLGNKDLLNVNKAGFSSSLFQKQCASQKLLPTPEINISAK